HELTAVAQHHSLGHVRDDHSASTCYQAFPLGPACLSLHLVPVVGHRTANASRELARVLLELLRFAFASVASRILGDRPDGRLRVSALGVGSGLIVANGSA